MTAKKKPRTGGDGAPSNSLHGNDGSWGELSITAILRPGREHRNTTGAGGLSHTHQARRQVGCFRLPRPRDSRRITMRSCLDWIHGAAGAGPAHNKSPGRVKLDRGWHLP